MFGMEDEQADAKIQSAKDSERLPQGDFFPSKILEVITSNRNVEVIDETFTLEQDLKKIPGLIVKLSNVSDMDISIGKKQEYFNSAPLIETEKEVIYGSKAILEFAIDYAKGR